MKLNYCVMSDNTTVTFNSKVIAEIKKVKRVYPDIKFDTTGNRRIQLTDAVRGDFLDCIVIKSSKYTTVITDSYTCSALATLILVIAKYQPELKICVSGAQDSSKLDIIWKKAIQIANQKLGYSIKSVYCTENEFDFTLAEK